MLCRDLLAFAPRLDPASRTLGGVQDRFASEEGRRHRLVAFRSPLSPTARHPRPTHKRLCAAEPTG